MSSHAPYNPLEKVNLGISVAEAMLSQPVHPLGDIPTFSGAGIYAIYYKGTHPAYEKLAAVNASQGPTFPIYVGKAIPEGGRKGGGGVTSSRAGASKALFKRLGEHAESIRATQLSIDDFACRFLVVDDIWIPLGESLLIAKFSPVWNLLVDGFGNHDPGKGRYNGLVPKWDVLHPGRTWAPKCKPRAETSIQISTEVSAWLEQAPSLMQSRHFVREAEAVYRVLREDSSGMS
jgi:Eco29kI restriction endonuclease